MQNIFRPIISNLFSKKSLRDKLLCCFENDCFWQGPFLRHDWEFSKNIHGLGKLLFLKESIINSESKIFNVRGILTIFLKPWKNHSDY